MRLFAAGVALALLLGPLPVRADDIDEAKIHYQAGKSYFDRADYLSAMRQFQASYNLSKRGLLLFNIGLCQEKLGDYLGARHSLDAYLKVPESKPDHELVQQKLIRLDQLIREREAEEQRQKGQASTVVPPPGGSATGARTRTWGYYLIAGGGVVVATAIGLGVGAHLQYGELAGKCGADGKRCPADFTGQRDLGRNLALATDVLLPVGVAAAIAGTVVVLVKEQPKRVALAPILGPTTVGAAAEVRF